MRHLRRRPNGELSLHRKVGHHTPALDGMGSTAMSGQGGLNHTVSLTEGRVHITIGHFEMIELIAWALQAHRGCIGLQGLSTIVHHGQRLILHSDEFNRIFCNVP